MKLTVETRWPPAGRREKETFNLKRQPTFSEHLEILCLHNYPCLRSLY